MTVINVTAATAPKSLQDLAPKLVIIAVFVTLAFFVKAVYDIYFHPLSRYPGPKACAVSHIPRHWHGIKGDLPYWTKRLHDQYGPVVRLAPHNLSYTSLSAFKDIFGHIKGDGEMSKATTFIPNNGVHGLISANRENHARMRRTVAHAFSEKALREQESYLQGYVNKLVERLKDVVSEGPQDLVKWYNYATFDLIGDLSFGESFGCLDTRGYHIYIAQIFASIKVQTFQRAFRELGFGRIISFLTPASKKQLTKDRNQFAYDKLEARLGKKEDRKDFLSYMLRDDEHGMSRGELQTVADLFIIAGSETTATLLSGATYLLLSNIEKHETLVKEVRGAFKEDADITLASVGQLNYMLAVLDESLRLYPPVPTAQTRVVPGNGHLISGEFVPPGTWVDIPHLAAYRDPINFHDPEAFVPERWLTSTIEDPSSPYHNDQRSAIQPFSYGARNCIGKNLAYAEMRLIMAKMLFHFNMELTPESVGWREKQKVYILWEKHPLMVKLTARSTTAKE